MFEVPYKTIESTNGLYPDGLDPIRIDKPTINDASYN